MIRNWMSGFFVRYTYLLIKISPKKKYLLIFLVD